MTFLRFFKRSVKKRRRTILRTQGKIYDLQALYESVNAEYFDAKLDLRITWFGRGVVPRTRILFGSYDHRNRLVKINRFLDKKEVPEHFVRYIIYHEMLHHVLPPIRGKNGRRSIHHSQFKQREKAFGEYSLARNFLNSFKIAPKIDS